ncbi:MAG: hypothetical protein R2830_26655 [Saprospiraceae bacterium]
MEGWSVLAVSRMMGMWLVRSSVFSVLQTFEAVLFGHHHVADNEVGDVFEGHFNTCLPVFGGEQLGDEVEQLLAIAADEFQPLVEPIFGV